MHRKKLSVAEPKGVSIPTPLHLGRIWRNAYICSFLLYVPLLFFLVSAFIHVSVSVEGQREPWLTLSYYLRVGGSGKEGGSQQF